MICRFWEGIFPPLSFCPPLNHHPRIDCSAQSSFRPSLLFEVEAVPSLSQVASFGSHCSLVRSERRLSLLEMMICRIFIEVVVPPCSKKIQTSQLLQNDRLREKIGGSDVRWDSIKEQPSLMETNEMVLVDESVSTVHDHIVDAEGAKHADEGAKHADEGAKHADEVDGSVVHDHKNNVAEAAPAAPPADEGAKNADESLEAATWDGNGPIRIFPTGFRHQLQISYSRPVTDQTQIRYRSSDTCMCVYKLYSSYVLGIRVCTF